MGIRPLENYLESEALTDPKNDCLGWALLSMRKRYFLGSCCRLIPLCSTSGWTSWPAACLIVSIVPGWGTQNDPGCVKAESGDKCSRRDAVIKVHSWIYEEACGFQIATLMLFFSSIIRRVLSLVVSSLYRCTLLWERMALWPRPGCDQLRSTTWD